MVAFLKCRVSRGMFSDERIVEVPIRNGQTATFVVETSAIKDIDEQGNGKLRVQIVSQNGGRLAMLPTVYQDALQVNEQDLVPA